MKSHVVFHRLQTRRSFSKMMQFFWQIFHQIDRQIHTISKRYTTVTHSPAD